MKEKETLIEIGWSPVELLEEVQEGGNAKGPPKVKGVAVKAGHINQNGRRYRKKIIEDQEANLNEKISKGKFLGELDHPKDGMSTLARTAVKYTKLWWEGDLFNYEAEILPTEDGRKLHTLLKAGVSVENSIRGTGSTTETEENGQKFDDVDDGYQLIGIDFVTGHSDENAEVKAFHEGGDVMTLEEFKKNHPDLYKAVVEEVLAAERKKIEEEVSARLEKEIDEKIAEEVENKAQEIRGQIEEELREEISEELVPHYEEHKETLVEIAKLLAPFMDELKDLVTNEKDDELAQVEKKLEQQGDAISKLQEENRSLKAELKDEKEKGVIEKYIKEKLANEPFKTFLQKRLEKAKTKEEVDRLLEEAKEDLKTLEETTKQKPAPKGQTVTVPERPEEGEYFTKEQQEKIVQMSGVPAK